MANEGENQLNSHHRTTYESFMAITKNAVIFIVIGLALMYFFLIH